MGKKASIILASILVLSFLYSSSFSQTYIDDTLAVRAILDSSGYTTIPVEDVSDSSGGRITEIRINLGGPITIGLTRLPSEIGNITNIKIIDLFWNSLSSIPAEIGNLSNLTSLELGMNGLTGLPPEIGNLNNLTYLGLFDNYFVSIPPEIGNLNNITSLDISSNYLSSIPVEIVNLNPTVYCDFGFNNLDTAKLSDAVIAWLDIYDPDWRNTQTVSIIYNTDINPSKSSINIEKSLIQFNLPTSGNIKLQIYTPTGRLVSTLVDSYKQAGEYKVNFNGNRFCSGVYYIKLTAGNNSLIQKVFIVK